MGECRLNDPAILASWLDGNLDLEIVRAVDGHLLRGCPVCWSVLRFVERLRELVGDGGPAPRATTTAVLLDSEVLLRAIGLPPRGAPAREMVVEIGRFETSFRVDGEAGAPSRRLELRALDRRTLTPPARGLVLEVRRGDLVLARGPGPLRLTVQGPGLGRTALPVSL
jgi:hypothetical protein